MLFQFNYCTIKSIKSVKVVETYELFQFNYCTIKSSATQETLHLLFKFQFNYCTIKRSPDFANPQNLEEFQFNYCTIKSFRSGAILILQLHFNSTIVRLRALLVSFKAVVASISIQLLYD